MHRPRGEKENRAAGTSMRRPGGSGVTHPDDRKGRSTAAKTPPASLGDAPSDDFVAMFSVPRPRDTELDDLDTGPGSGYLGTPLSHLAMGSAIDPAGGGSVVASVSGSGSGDALSGRGEAGGGGAANAYLAALMVRQRPESVQVQDEHGVTPLGRAFLARNMPVAEAFLGGGADPCVADLRGRNIVHYAAIRADEPAMVAWAVEAVAAREAAAAVSPVSAALFHATEAEKTAAAEGRNAEKGRASRSGGAVENGRNKNDGNGDGDGNDDGEGESGDGMMNRKMNKGGKKKKASTLGDVVVLGHRAGGRDDGDAEDTGLLISPGLDARDASGRTALSHACGRNHSGGASALLATERVDPDARDRLGWTPLHHAAMGGAAACARLLVAAGAELHVCDTTGACPAHVAARRGDVPTLRACLGHFARTALSQRALHGSSAEREDARRTGAGAPDDSESVASLSVSSATASPPDTSRSGAGGGASVVRAGPAESGEQLSTEAQIVLAVHDDEGLTPLHAAARAGEVKAVRYLLAVGADPNGDAGDAGGGGPAESVQVAPAAGAKRKQRTPLAEAAAAGSLAAVIELTRAGARVGPLEIGAACNDTVRDAIREASGGSTFAFSSEPHARRA